MTDIYQAMPKMQNASDLEITDKEIADPTTV